MGTSPEFRHLWGGTSSICTQFFKVPPNILSSFTRARHPAQIRPLWGHPCCLSSELVFWILAQIGVFSSLVLAILGCPRSLCPFCRFIVVSPLLPLPDPSCNSRIICWDPCDYSNSVCPNIPVLFQSPCCFQNTETAHVCGPAIIMCRHIPHNFRFSVLGDRLHIVETDTSGTAWERVKRSRSLAHTSGEGNEMVWKLTGLSTCVSHTSIHHWHLSVCTGYSSYAPCGPSRCRPVLPLHRQTGLGGDVYSSQTLSLKRCGFLPTFHYRFQQAPSGPSGSCLGGTKVKNSHGTSREDVLPTPKPRTPICSTSSFCFAQLEMSTTSPTTYVLHAGLDQKSETRDLHITQWRQIFLPRSCCLFQLRRFESEQHQPSPASYQFVKKKKVQSWSSTFRTSTTDSLHPQLVTHTPHVSQWWSPFFDTIRYSFQKTRILSVRSRSHSVIDDGIYEIMLQRRLSTCIVQLDMSEHAARQVLLQVPFWPMQDKVDTHARNTTVSRLTPNAAQSKSTTSCAMRLLKPMLSFHSLALARAPRSHGPVPFQECKSRGIITHAENGAPSSCYLPRAN